jgi:hypothetical protein
MPEHQSTTIKNYAAFIWSVAALLSGDYNQSSTRKSPISRKHPRKPANEQRDL